MQECCQVCSPPVPETISFDIDSPTMTTQELIEYSRNSEKKDAEPVINTVFIKILIVDKKNVLKSTFFFGGGRVNVIYLFDILHYIFVFGALRRDSDKNM